MTSFQIAMWVFIALQFFYFAFVLGYIRGRAKGEKWMEQIKEAEMSLSKKQEAVMLHVRENGQITVQQAVSLIGGNLYANAAFHVGNTLRRMVDRGLLERKSRGVYRLPLDAPKQGGLFA